MKSLSRKKASSGRKESSAGQEISDYTLLISGVHSLRLGDSGATARGIICRHNNKIEELLMGVIFQLNRSDGGVPKLAVEEALVTETGLVGDRQAHTKIHGGPERAVCLFSLERIEELQREGHPITPGSTGENVTVKGLDWSELAPGVRLALGDEVVLEITSYTNPCNNIAASFIKRNYKRIAQKKHPGYSRLYARVISTGRLRVGQAVRVLESGGNARPSMAERVSGKLSQLLGVLYI
jgi:MOSC domain-containing protein YiiM